MLFPQIQLAATLAKLGSLIVASNEKTFYRTLLLALISFHERMAILINKLPNRKSKKSNQVVIDLFGRVVWITVHQLPKKQK